MNQLILKYAAATLLFGAWGALVLLGKAPADSFIAGIQGALVALGVFHMRGTQTGTQTDTQTTHKGGEQ